MHSSVSKKFSFIFIILFCALFFHTTVADAQAAPVTANCAPSQNSIVAGDAVSWVVNANGGSGSYSYAWADTTGATYLSGGIPSWSKSYTAAGSYSTSLYVVSSDGQTVSVNCAPALTVVAKAVPIQTPVTPMLAAVTATCSPNTNSIEAGKFVTWTVAAKGGSGAYSYSWADTAGNKNLVGSKNAWPQAYFTPGIYSASVYVVSSDGQTVPVTCSPVLTVAQKAVPMPTPTAILASLNASPSSGQQGVVVRFSGNTASGCNGGNFTLVFGDSNSIEIALPADLCRSTISAAHTYASPGIFTASLVSNGGVVLASTNITVTALADNYQALVQPTPVTTMPAYESSSLNQSYYSETAQNIQPDDCLVLTRNLVRGTSDSIAGGEVAKLQNYLGVTQSGFFGSLTKQAVKDWQIAHRMSIPQTSYGSVGPLTRRAFQSSCTQTPADEIGL